MMKAEIVLLVGLIIVLTGCTIGGSEPVPAQLPLASAYTVTDAPILPAERAYQEGDRL